MGYVKKTIKELSKEAGSKKKASALAEKWYKDGLRAMSEKTVQQYRGGFRSGKIYVFEYNPITPDLEWFDKNPVVLALEQVNGKDLGINLNLLPNSVKEDLLDELYDRMEGQIKFNSTGKGGAESERPLRITYNGMKAYLKRYGYDFAIRQYIPSRKTNQGVVSYSEWPKIALCKFIELDGATIGQINRLFNNSL